MSGATSPADELVRRLAKPNGAEPDALTMDIAADELQRIAELEQRQQGEVERKSKGARP